jgi:hypothetical protein
MLQLLFWATTFWATSFVLGDFKVQCNFLLFEPLEHAFTEWVHRNARAHRTAAPAPTSMPGLLTAIRTPRLQSVYAYTHGTVALARWTRIASSCPCGCRAVDCFASADTSPAPVPSCRSCLVAGRAS